MEWKATLIPKSIMECYQELTSFDIVKENSLSPSILYRWNRKRCQSCPIFDLKDLHILAKKVSFLSMPLFVKRWVIDFLMNRQQLLLLVINDLQPPSVQPWKYIDDTTISEVVPKGSTTNIQTTEKTRTCDLFFKNCKQFPKLKYQLWSA